MYGDAGIRIIDADTQTSTTETSSTSSSSTTITSTSKTTEKSSEEGIKKLLPRTGEEQANRLLLLGLLVVFSSIFIIRMKKKIKEIWEGSNLFI